MSPARFTESSQVKNWSRTLVRTEFPGSRPESILSALEILKDTCKGHKVVATRHRDEVNSKTVHSGMQVELRI